MPSSVPPYRCRLCGASSYRRLLHRAPDGAMAYSGIYRCSGCTLEFSDPSEWHAAQSEPGLPGGPGRGAPQGDASPVGDSQRQ